MADLVYVSAKDDDWARPRASAYGIGRMIALSEAINLYGTVRKDKSGNPVTDEEGREVKNLKDDNGKDLNPPAVLMVAGPALLKARRVWAGLNAEALRRWADGRDEVPI